MGKRRKPAWQGAWHENTMMLHADGVLGGELVNQPAGGRGVGNYEASCEWRFQPPNTLQTEIGNDEESRGQRDRDES